MPGSADFIQRTVHAIEAGGLAVWIRRGLAVVAVIALALFYFIHEFRGLATSQAMDQAQIGRNFSEGRGWRTDFIRPRAVGQLQENGRAVLPNIWRDTYNAPLPAVINALALLPMRNGAVMTPRDVTYVGDKLIVLAAICLFLAALVVIFLTARRLFDQRLALIGTGLVLVSDMIWQYAVSGLPQMLMLLLFSIAVYLLVRALETRAAGGNPLRWLGAAGALFGLLALSHALTIWIFVGALVFCGIYFRPRLISAGVMLGAFAVLYAPWLMRNHAITGNPGGVAVYSVFHEINHTEAGHMRRVELDLEDVTAGYFRNKLTGHLRAQAGRIFEYLGWNLVALVFFVALLHRFRRSETAVMRWLVLAMWGGAFLGMLVYGMPEEEGFSANQLHLLFVPMMTCYGVAFLLVQWNRLEINIRAARLAFLTLLFVICGFPMLLTIALPVRKPAVRWPPYVPPYIAVLNTWMEPGEIVASDMPWAVAWYADRKAIWVPFTVKAFTDLSDYNVLGGPINGLYLTPISGSSNTLRDILKGEYRHWSGLILRSTDLQKFPLKWATLLGMENEAVFYSNRSRLTNPEP